MCVTRIFPFTFLLLSATSMAQQPKLVVPTGHTKHINSAVYSSNGKYIVTASDDNTAKIWSAMETKLLIELKGHTDRVNSAVFSPDGKTIVTAANDSTARIWDASSGKLLLVLKDPSDYVSSANYSPDGRHILTTSWDNTARIWNAANGKLLMNLGRHSNAVNSAIYSPDGNQIVTTSRDSTAKIWSAGTPSEKAADGKLLIELKGHSGWVNSAAYSPDGKYIVTASFDTTAKIWDAATGKMLRELRGSHTSFVYSAIYSPDGKNIATICEDEILRIWNAADGELIAETAGNFQSAAYSPDGKYLVTAFIDWAKIWEVNTGGLFGELKGNASFFFSAMYSPDGKHLLTACFDYSGGTVKTWNTADGKLVKEFVKQPMILNLAINSPACPDDPAGGKYIAIASSDRMVRIRSALDEKLVREFKHADWINTVDFSPDGKYLVTASRNDTARIWDIADGTLHAVLTGHSSWVNSAAYSSDGRFIVTSSLDKMAIIWNAADGKLLTRLEGHDLEVNSAVYSPDGRFIVTSSNDNTPRIWKADDGKLVTLLQGHNDNVNSAVFSPDGKYIVTTSWENTAMTWDAVTGKPLKELAGHTLDVRSAVYSPDGKNIVTIGEDRTAIIWDAKTGEQRYKFLTTDSLDYLALIPRGYYRCSQNAARLLYYVKGLQVITFDQLDIKYNRPDKVLEAIGNTDTALIKSYRKAYEKRIKKLGIDTTAFRDGYSVPECDFVNRDAIAFEQKTGTLKLHIKGMDSTYKLDRFNVWVNEVPVFGQRGISIKKKNSNSIDTTISINLSQGENRVETSITNVNGTESYRMPLIVNYTPALKQKETLRFIGIGIDKFVDPKNNLQYSSKDIRDLAGKLKEKYKEDIIIDTLFNEKVTIGNVQALKTKLQQTNENDKVIISYSGHGLLSKEYDYYLSTYSINFDKPEENGLPYDELENLLDSIPARKKLMLIDACHSGEVDKEEITLYKAAEDLLKKQGTKGGELRYTGKTQVGMKNSFELMQSLFVNVGKSTGATIISAAAGTQFALERDDLMNGVFTYSILEAMDKNPTMKISELKKIVGQRVEQLTNGLQKPTSRNETIAVDWSLW